MQALEALQKPLAALARRLEAVLENAPDWLDSQARARVEGAIRGLAWRRETLGAWIALLARIGGEGDPEFVDWLAVERIDGREIDVAIHRRWLDPTRSMPARWSTSSATIRAHRCSALTRCATESMCPANRCGWWSWSACRGRGRPCFTPRDGWRGAAAPMTTASSARALPRRSVA